MLNVIQIAIIGGGPSGVSLCLQLADLLSDSILKPLFHIAIFEKKHAFGHGLAYALQDNAFCINLPKDHMRLKPDEHHQFSDWLTHHDNLKDEQFPPRHYFGQYCEEQLSKLLKNSSLNIKAYTEHEVFDINRTSHHYKVCARNKQTSQIFFADYVILALGHLPSTYPSLEKHTIDPWNIQNYQNVPPYAHIGIIGTRLTAIDVALKLKQQHHQGNISMMSNSGLLSAVRGNHRVPNMRYLTTYHLKPLLQQKNDKILEPLLYLLEQELKLSLPFPYTLSQVIQWTQTVTPADHFRYQMLQAATQKTAWQSVLSCFYQILFKLWPMMHLREQRSFLEIYGSLLFTFLCSFPLEKARLLHTMVKKSQLTLHRGLLQVKKTPAGYEARFTNEASLHIDHLFLATGSSLKLETISLLTNMLQHKLIEKHPLGGICVHPKTYQVQSKTYPDATKMYALGDLTTGACFKTIELGQIVAQGKIIVEHILTTFKACSSIKHHDHYLNLKP